MSMVMLAMLFMLEQRLQNQTDIPLLSCGDVTTLLKSVLTRRDISEDEILDRLGSGTEKDRTQLTSPTENNRNTMC